MRLPENLKSFILHHGLLKPGERVAIAVSGGADSVALLRALLELRIEIGVVISVAHFNHRIRGAASDLDEEFVRELSRQYQLEFHCDAGDVPAYAGENQLSLETAAQRLRYAFFERLVQAKVVDKVATAHTRDDQAETVLMRLLRGAGSRGIAGIYPQHQEGAKSFVVRPMLQVRRRELEAYLTGLKQPWREDASNQDLRHSRNRIRHQLLPMLERDFNPAITQVLSDLAEVSRGEDDYWKAEVARLLPLALSAKDDSASTLNLEILRRQPLAVQRLLIRATAESFGSHLDFADVEHLLRLAGASRSQPPEKLCSLPGDLRARLTRRGLSFEKVAGAQKAAPRSPGGCLGYQYELTIPGDVSVPELGSRVCARMSVVPGEDKTAETSGETAVSFKSMVESLPERVVIRNWRPGDRFWPLHAKSPKKIKELLQRRRLSGTERYLWPVASSDDTVIWMRGFAMSQQCARSGYNFVIVEEFDPPGGDTRAAKGLN